MQIQKVTHFHVWLFKNFNNYIGSFDLTPKLKGMCNVIPCKCTLTIWYHFVSLISQNGWMSSNVFIRAHLDTFLSILILATTTSPSPFSHLAIAGGGHRRTCGPQWRRLRALLPYDLDMGGGGVCALHLATLVMGLWVRLLRSFGPATTWS
jgi:hypothetical protein